MSGIEFFSSCFPYFNTQRAYILTPQNHLRLNKKGDFRAETGYGSHLLYLHSAYTPVNEQALYLDMAVGRELDGNSGGISGFDLGYGLYRHMKSSKSPYLDLRMYAGQYLLDAEITGLPRVRSVLGSGSSFSKDMFGSYTRLMLQAGFAGNDPHNSFGFSVRFAASYYRHLSFEETLSPGKNGSDPETIRFKRNDFWLFPSIEPCVSYRRSKKGNMLTHFAFGFNYCPGVPGATLRRGKGVETPSFLLSSRIMFLSLGFSPVWNKPARSR